MTAVPPIHYLERRRQTWCGADPRGRVALFIDEVTCPQCRLPKRLHRTGWLLAGQTCDLPGCTACDPAFAAQAQESRP